LALYSTGGGCSITYADSSNWSYDNFGRYGVITTGAWHHVVVTKNNSNIVNIFLDGNNLISKSFGGAI
jgi:hypothetical protein